MQPVPKKVISFFRDWLHNSKIFQKFPISFFLETIRDFKNLKKGCAKSVPRILLCRNQRRPSPALVRSFWGQRRLLRPLGPKKPIKPTVFLAPGTAWGPKTYKTHCFGTPGSSPGPTGSGYFWGRPASPLLGPSAQGGGS